MGLLLTAAGVALIVWLARKVGWPAVATNIRLIGGWFPVLVAIYLVPQAAFFLGWWIVMDPRPEPRELPRLFGVYLAGDSLNYLAPGGVAGEPLKVRLLSEEMDPGRALAAVTLHKHVDFLAQWLFVVAGVVVTLAGFPLPPRIRVAALAGVGLLGALLLLWTLSLRRGTYGPALRWLSRFRPLEGYLARHRGSARSADARIRRFHGARRGRFALAAALCFVGWCGGLVETYLVLRLLAPGSGWPAAFGVECLSMVLATMLLFIPGRLGGAEGARAGVCLLLGLTAVQGVAYGLVRRARELVWALPGLLVLLFRRARTRPSTLAPRVPAAVAGGEARS